MGWTTIQRREFLITTSQVVGGMVVSSILPATPTGAANSNLVELSATAAVAAIRNGDIKAENYARALLDRAQQLASLNAFRILDREMVLEAARNADKRRGTLTSGALRVRNWVCCTDCRFRSRTASTPRRCPHRMAPAPWPTSGRRTMPRS